MQHGIFPPREGWSHCHVDCSCHEQEQGATGSGSGVYIGLPNSSNVVPISLSTWITSPFHRYFFFCFALLSRSPKGLGDFFTHCPSLTSKQALCLQLSALSYMVSHTFFFSKWELVFYKEDSLMLPMK